MMIFQQLRWPIGTSVRLGSCRLGLNSESGQTNDLKIGMHQSRRQSSRLRGGQAFVRGGQSLKLSTKAAVFKRVSLLIGGGGSKHVDWGGQASLARALVCTASLLDAQHESDGVENKPASLLVVPLGKTLGGISPSWCGRQMTGYS